MSVKTTGFEFKTFYNDNEYWNKLLDADDKVNGEVYHDEMQLEVNGVQCDESFSIEDELKDEDAVVIRSGFIVSTSREMPLSMESFFKAWRKEVDTAYVLIKVPKAKLEAVKVAVKEAGGKVV